MAHHIRATEHALSMAFTLGAICGLAASLAHPSRWEVLLVLCFLAALTLYDAIQLRRHKSGGF